jgi:type I restriction enzyme M protein
MRIAVFGTGGIGGYLGARLAQDVGNVELNFNNYLNGYSKNVREIIENFQLEKIVSKLAKNDLLFKLVEMFAEVDLSLENVTNHDMGYIFEDLLRLFYWSS